MQDCTPEAQREALLDRRIMQRLATDRAYVNAASSEEQSDREQEIEREEAARLAREIAEARARREQSERSNMPRGAA